MTIKEWWLTLKIVVTIKEYVMINGEERDLDGMAEKPNEWDDFHLLGA